ncbi:MAG: hypothetical protein OMM_02599 [Candidatus Magnetoglobus multicellularis str. Araruama]|uniref:IPTL-CTERM protein sorting domain-containing protein n=1 Tax=Candidatus Magnetoglobus multicellularis str. Araruama TaxID=890399 RepID=A0A1V1P8W4_9BACT|nr:MAG: hypothetical protein OMM_02599 [Candidatus Magnetoglobus multicellularis str. Araruama]
MTTKENKTSSLSKKIAKYSMTAGGTLLLCSQALASPQYSGIQNINITNNEFELDINADGQIDFVFANFYLGSGSYKDNYNVVIPPKTISAANGVIKGEPRGRGFYAPRLSIGQQISPEQSFAQGNYFHFLGFYLDSEPYGNFWEESGFIGVNFKIGDNTHYGWVQFEGPHASTYGKIIDWGYEDQADTHILAGEPEYITEEEPRTATVPTLNEWGILILMALILEESIRRMRKEKETVFN